MKLAHYEIEFKHPTTIDKPKMNMRRVRVVTNKRTLTIARLEMSIYTWYKLEKMSLAEELIHDLVLTCVYDRAIHIPLTVGTITFFSPFMEYSRAVYGAEAADLAAELMLRL